jgi:hypothetical protein
LTTTNKRKFISDTREANKTPHTHTNTHTQNSFANFVDFSSSQKPKKCKREII